MSRWSKLKRRLMSWKTREQEEEQVQEEIAPARSVMSLGNRAMNAAPYMAELQSRLSAPASDTEETQEDTVGDAAPETTSAPSQETASGTDSASAPDTASGTHTAAGKASLADLYGQLKSSKRGGFHIGSGNSAYYKKVTEALRSINESMGQEDFSEDLEKNLRQISRMEERYQELLDACADYVARNPSTKTGKIRRDIVLTIQETAARDLLGLGAARTEFCSIPEAEQAGKSWSEIIDKSRALRLVVSNFAALGKAEGGQASEVLKLHGGNAKVRGANGDTPLADLHFFKPEDEIDLSQTTNEARIVNKVLERFPGLPKKEAAAIRAWAMSEKEDKKDEKPSELSELGERALAAVEMNAAGVDTAYKAIIKPAGIGQEGDKVNLTKRNVATSRMAALLGLGHLVAKSETVEIFDEATQHTIRGNLMEKANGSMSMGELITQHRKAGAKHTAVKAGGNVQRDLLNLQVLDVLCGQVDRHTNNILVTLDRQAPVNDDNPLAGDETITGIMGIDNDGAFGTITDASSATDPEKHDRRVYDPKTGEMTLPYMDKNLANRIRELSPEAVRFALKGLITEDEIGAALKRLELMKNAIEKTPEERFLEDHQWNDETAQELFRQNWESYGELFEEQERYVVRGLGEILKKETGVDIAAIPKEERTPEQQEKYLAASRAHRTRLNKEFRVKERGANLRNYFGRVMTLQMMEAKGEKDVKGQAPKLRSRK